jgi:hypothetical protein
MSDDPRRRLPITISWSAEGIGRLKIGRERWAAIEWSTLSRRWCIEDNSGRCLTHVGSIRGDADSKEAALALAEAMIRDGRMPTPQEARAAYAERVAADRQMRLEALHQMMDAEARKNKAPAIYEMLSEAFDLTDPNLWKSNSFASMRPGLIVHVEADIAQLEYQIVAYAHDLNQARRLADLDRKRAILRALKGEPA